MPDGPDPTPPPPSDGQGSTRDRLLDAAERLFLRRGVDQVSVRAVNAEAGLNPGAVHYHFGSREGLVGALLERELFPLWEERLKRATGRPDRDATPLQQVDALVTAAVGPFDELVRTDRGRMLCRLLAQTLLGADRPLAGSQWSGTAPFEVVLGRALPDLGVQEVADRWRLVFTTLLTIYGRPLAPDTPGGSVPAFPATATVIAFLTAGLATGTVEG
ncbi:MULTISPECIES: TetR/AcrR family transcriptional regulator [unclassified Streptomyces]|uniref:TetR/AcrR family transcriptional regulator n=1 Tax=unclassified Streptomyces TaxID=2593676 RepID=UPI0016603C37|nr:MULTISPECIES: TetR/AcrR family transcriptional regulator [unclassified Streptomyces]MBD0711960.1 TetR family transcriptional regulator [Streptomyces sp. CBMA291]MBD0713278.1 TetR family transcriptional regulator [Streptomyces sp. CBMA370]